LPPRIACQTGSANWQERAHRNKTEFANAAAVYRPSGRKQPKPEMKWSLTSSKQGARKLFLPAIRQLVDLGSQDEIAFAQAINLVRPDCDLHSAPGQTDVRMMTLLFGQFTNLIGESQRVAKVFERKLLLQMVPIDNIPSIAQFPVQVSERLSLQWRRAAFAWDAVFVGQLTHNAAILGSNRPHFQPTVRCARYQSTADSMRANRGGPSPLGKQRF
jgi:hypothetical protein